MPTYIQRQMMLLTFDKTNLYKCNNIRFIPNIIRHDITLFTAQVHYGCNKQRMQERIRRRGLFDYLYHRRLMCFCQHYDASNSR